MASNGAEGVLDPGGQNRVVRAALVRFAWGSVIALVLLTVGAVIIGGRIAEDAALREAQLRGQTIANTIAGPLVDDHVRGRDPGALARLDRVMLARMEDGSLSHVKLWSRDGHVLWADEKDLVGDEFELDEDVSSLFGTRKVTAELSDLSKAENAGERAEGELLEVYAGTFDADGEPVVFEAYLATDRMRQDERRIITDILPLTIGGLLLFQLAVLPLAVSLARRVERGENERSRMMRHTLLVAAQEQRRIAQDLHDGVIQDLAGLSYAMPVVAAHLPDTPEAQGARDAVARVSTVLQEDVAALRSLLTDIYPPDLHGDGFTHALQDLAQQARERGTEVEVMVPPGYDESIDVNRLAYRVVREGLRNVVKHARAAAARVEVSRADDRLHVRVSDDGVGLDGPPEAEPGHLGLKLLHDTLRDFGGRLEVRPGARGGTVMEATFPVPLFGG